MTAIIDEGDLVWGMQLPVQAQSRTFVRDWELAGGPDDIVAVAKALDRAGAFYVAVCDHVAVPNDLVHEMGAVWYDPLATLAWLAAATQRVHLLSHVAVLAYRHPLVTAKGYGTLDRLSGGRAILGVGAGHVEREFEILGVDFAERGRMLDAAIDEIRATWTTDSIHGATVAPRPLRPGGLPIWVGGSSPAAMRRAARRGDGWLPQGPPAAGMRRAVEAIRAERVEHLGDEPIDLGGFCEPVHVGPPHDELPEYTASGAPEEIAERLRRHRSYGLSHLQVTLPSRSRRELVEQIELFGAEVWPLVID